MTKRLKPNVGPESEECQNLSTGVWNCVFCPGEPGKMGVYTGVGGRGGFGVGGRPSSRSLSQEAGLHVGAHSSNQWSGQREGREKESFITVPSTPGICTDIDVAPPRPQQSQRRNSEKWL